MTREFPADCLHEIFEYLEDREDLYSCLLVNRLWCKISVRFLWKNIQNFNTLITLLSDESKKVLSSNKIIITTPPSKPILFNYLAFIKNLSINEIIESVSINQPHASENDQVIIAQEIFKMFMNR